MKILFVTLGTPYPPDIGPRLRDYHLIRAAAEHHSVFVLSLDSAPDARAQAELSRWCEFVQIVPDVRRSPLRHVRQATQGLLSGRPLAMHPFFFPELAAAIRQIVQTNSIDIVQIEHSFLAGYVDAIPRESGCRAVLSLHNLGDRQYRGIFATQTSPGRGILFGLKWLAMLGWEARFARRFDHVITVSRREQRLLLSRDATLAVTSIENGVDTVVRQPLPPKGTSTELLFVGTLGYPPNSDAVRYFAKSILPLVQAQAPDVSFTVVGGGLPERTCRLADGERLRIAGRVDDVVPWYADAAVTVVPLRAGGGTRLKILESMALGRPVVSTSIGCEGLDVVHGRHLLIADGPKNFARAVVRLLQDAPLRQLLTENARALVERSYDWKNIGRKLNNVYGQLREPAGAEPRPARALTGLGI